MRWQHIKTVMIAILLVVNLWLGGLLINRNLTQNYLDKDVLQNTVEILGRDGILLSVDQLDAGRRTADLFSAPFPESTPLWLRQALPIPISVWNPVMIRS